MNKPTNSEKIIELENQIMSVSKDVQVLARSTEKLDEVIIEMKRLSENTSKIIAIHDEKHKFHEKELAKREHDIFSIHKKIDNIESKVLAKIESNSKENAKTLEPLQRSRWMIIGAISLITFGASIGVAIVSLLS